MYLIGVCMSECLQGALQHAQMPMYLLGVSMSIYVVGYLCVCIYLVQPTTCIDLNTPTVYMIDVCWYMSRCVYGVLQDEIWSH